MIDSIDIQTIGPQPPHDDGAETTVLIAAIHRADKRDEMLSLLRPEHFYAPWRGRVFETIGELARVGRAVDLVGILSWVTENGHLDAIGGAASLDALAHETPAAVNAESHAQTVLDRWRERQLISTCQKIVGEGFREHGATSDWIDRSEQAVYAVARQQKRNDAEKVGPILNRVMTEAARRGSDDNYLEGLRTGYAALDEKLGGLCNGEFIIVAGRPGMGKTAWVMSAATNICAPICEQEDAPPVAFGAGVAVFSLEMLKAQLGQRLICAEARLDLLKFRRGKLDADGWRRAYQAHKFLSNVPMWIDDTPAISLTELRSKARRYKAQADSMTYNGQSIGLGLVVVDHVGLMKSPSSQKSRSREQELSEISAGLKQLAKELNVPVVALAQLNRGVEARTTKDKRPQLSDLRESGSLEQDADTVLMLYRDEYYHPDTTRKGIAEILVRKARSGECGKVYVRFTGSCTRFDQLSATDYEGLRAEDE